MRSRQDVSTYLRENGFRLTPQRERILDIFYSLPEGEHLSADDLHVLLKREGHEISLATSYRTLKLLASLGVLRELDFAEDHKHYELFRNEPEGHHHHLICIECGYTEEFNSEVVFHEGCEIAQARNFESVDVQLKLFVRCKNLECPHRNTQSKHHTHSFVKPVNDPEPSLN